MHDPFQTYSMLGAYPGTTGALGLIPPALSHLGGGMSPFGLQSGISGYGGIPQQLGQQIPHYLQQQLQQQALQQQLQLAAILAAQGGNPQLQGLSPFLTGWHNPLAQTPLVSQIWQNPLLNPILAQQYQNPLGQQYQNPFGQQYQNPFGQQYQNPFGQQHQNPWQQHQNPFGQQYQNPFGQPIGIPFGQMPYPLAPQSWIGQQGFGGSPFGQGNPLLSQLGGRGIQGLGMSGF